MARVLAILLLLCVAFPAWSQSEQRPLGVRINLLSGSSVQTGANPTLIMAPRGGTNARIVGIVVWCVVSAISTDPFTAATWGGTSMGAALASANDTATELGFVEVYFLGSSIPQGTQTVQCSTADATNPKMVIAAALEADNTTTSSAGTCSVSENAANPSCTISSITAESLAMVAGFSGATTANVTANSGYRKRTSATMSSGSGNGLHQLFMQSSGNQAVGWTAANDDVAMVAIAVQQ